MRNASEGGINPAPESGGGNGMGMQMTFYWGKGLTLLFSGWMTTKPVHYMFMLLVVFVFAIFHQFLGHLLKLQSAKASDGKYDAPPGANWLKLVLQVVLYAAHTSTSYLLMLIVMSYNVGVFIAVVFGLSSGFLMFQKASCSLPDQGS